MCMVVTMVVCIVMMCMVVVIVVCITVKCAVGDEYVAIARTKNICGFINSQRPLGYNNPHHIISAPAKNNNNTT